MKCFHDIQDQYVKGKQPSKTSCGLNVRTNLKAGDWQCTSCEGEVMGNSLFKPSCVYCEHT